MVETVHQVILSLPAHIYLKSRENIVEFLLSLKFFIIKLLLWDQFRQCWIIWSLLYFIVIFIFSFQHILPAPTAAFTIIAMKSTTRLVVMEATVPSVTIWPATLRMFPVTIWTTAGTVSYIISSMEAAARISLMETIARVCL